MKCDIDPGDRVWHIPTLKWAYVQDTYPNTVAIIHEPTWGDRNPREIVVPRSDVRKERE